MNEEPTTAKQAESRYKAARRQYFYTGKENDFHKTMRLKTEWEEALARESARESATGLSDEDHAAIVEAAGASADELMMPATGVEARVCEDIAARQRDAYAETLRFMAETDEDWNLIRERHPEIEGNVQSPPTGGKEA